MLTLYLVALAIGGTLLIASLVMGHGHDHDADIGHVDADVDVAEADFDADMEADADADAGHDGFGTEVILAFLPIFSLRFWMFFLAFFGLTGTILTKAGLISSAAVHGAVAGATGYLCGMGVVIAFRKLKKNQTDSSLKDVDYVGASAMVMVGFAKGETGKVRLSMKGRLVELLAVTEEDHEFKHKQVVMVYGMTDEGKAIITRDDQSND